MGKTGGEAVKNKIDRYLKILKIELEDLESDIIDSEAMLKKRLDDKKITGYVFMENLATFRAELEGVRKMEKEIDRLADKYETLDELVEHISDYFKKRIKESGLPEAVFVLIKRKLDKIYRYIS